jgi:HEAT repeat protein
MRRRRFLLVAVALFGAVGLCAAGGSVHAATTDEETLKAANVGTTDQALLEFLRRRTLSDADRDRMKLLIQQLGDDSYQVREKASAELLGRGAAAEPLLRQALQSPDVEVVRRAEECLRLIKRGVSAAVPAAAVRLLAERKAAGAVEVLLAYLPFADTEAVAEEVRKALAAVAVRDGQPDPTLLAALSDASPLRRGTAAEAFCRAGAAAPREAIRKLLKDPEPSVRLQVGVALAAAKDKDAIPVLIDLLGQLPREQSWPAEDILLRLAGDKAPDVTVGTDAASRDKAREAWAAWWKDNQATVDLARLDKPTLLGYTLVLLLDAGRVVELDKHNKPRWQIDGLQFPLDVQLLPGNRVLVAEHGANKVTERDLKGKVIWEHHVDSPLVAQRLPNGNTFIATNEQLVEVTQAGKGVFTYTPPQGEYIMKAQKLRNGDIACVLSGSRFVRMDATGKELKSFTVNVATSGGRIDVLPNGHVLVPEHRANRLVEYDADGKVVWEAPVEQPIAAVGLPNGHVLVTSMNQQRAVELDANHKEVWEYKTTTRVTRAFRR